MNLAQGLVEELKRNRELLAGYKEIGSNGAFGATMIAIDISAGETAQRENDIVKILVAYETLKGNN